MLKADLLSADGVASISASRAFLHGITGSTLTMCCDALEGRFKEAGGEAFDARYVKSERFVVSEDSPSLNRISRDEPSEITSKPVPFKGITEFFFLVSALVRISFHSSLRVQQEFLQRYGKVWNAMGESAETSGSSPNNQVLVLARPVVTTVLGFNCLLEDPEVASLVTRFSILQLQWLSAVGSGPLSSIPEWMCKVPAQWLTHVARSAPHILKPYQAGDTVVCATTLVQLGTSSKSQVGFSPVVVADLIKIIAAFVNAGVNRAKTRQRQRFGRKFGDQNPGSFEDDDRNLDIYSSFDRNDLGVTVFTNRLVQTRLCPVLIHSFGALDIIEGLDVDRENGFDKFSVKAQIADLLLRLWSHPDGKCRESIVAMEDSKIAELAKSVAAAIGYLLDDACHRLADVCSHSKERRSVFDRRQQQMIESQSRSACYAFQSSRCLLLLLFQLSHEPKIASTFASNTASVSQELATMIVHFVDKLTGEDGGTNPDLDFAPSRIPVGHRRSDSKSNQEAAEEVMIARYRSSVLFGLDVSLFCHQFLALATCWHNQSKRDASGMSGIMRSLASHDYFQFSQFRNIYKRLIASRPKVHGTEGDNAELIAFHDGHVDNSLWVHNYETKLKESMSAEDKRQRATAAKNVITHNELSALASDKLIAGFLDELEVAHLMAQRGNVLLSKQELLEAQTKLLSLRDSMNAEEYGQKLAEWTVSSLEFANPLETGKYLHYYDTTARGLAVAGSGKTLVKEARRCFKTLPTPHPNSAAFVCFAEERMDLCRAIITGPVDTPYAHGIFVFDVFFPTNYPSIPPLVTFMTTGGGQTRFNPNLYQDGKVCLSLLGTWHAADESQKWNPTRSSLAQVLLSIQTQLLVEEPYFNEPGYEATQGTVAGKKASFKYNTNLRLATLRHAILGPLKKSPIGFEEVCKRHLSMCRTRILVQARRWLIEARQSPLYNRFERTYNEMVSELSKLDQDGPCLSPLRADVDVLRSIDRPFLSRFPSLLTNRRDDRKPSAAAYARSGGRVSGRIFGRRERASAVVQTSSQVVDWNPWANAAAGVASRAPTTTTGARLKKDNDGDDEDFDQLYD